VLQLRCAIEGEDRLFPLVGEEVRIGRSADNEIRLADPSVSRHHALLERTHRGWRLSDLGSTNGTHLNGDPVASVEIALGDLVKVGAFELTVEEVFPGHRAAPPPAPADRPDSLPPTREQASIPPAVPRAVPNATIVRPLEEFSAAYGFDLREIGELDEAPQEPVPGEEPWGQRVFGHLTRLGRLLIQATSVPDVLERVMGLAFEALPVERGFILLQDTDPGSDRPPAQVEVICELARIGDEVIHRPDEGVPVSSTILQAVMEDRLALLTYDALSDERLEDGDSIRLHGIRAAMSVPLWAGERIIGVLQVDSPVHAGAFRERDLDFLTAVANFAAVAIERLRSARRVEVERHMRSRFERYHSPSVIEEMMSEAVAAGALGGGGGADEADGDCLADAAGEAVQTLRATDASVLFADLVGFTAFAENARPEEVADLLAAYFEHVVEAIFSAGGTLDKFIGDSVMAFFGAPYDQPDHAERAVQAAIDTVETLERWNAERRERDLPVFDLRIAINSGPVVVGDVGTRRRVDYTVLGNTVNVAARFEQSVALPGQIVIGPETRRLVGEKFPVEPLGELQLKGLQQKISAFRVLTSDAAQ
jgi:adenylate cyclase